MESSETGGIMQWIRGDNGLIKFCGISCCVIVFAVCCRGSGITCARVWQVSTSALNTITFGYLGGKTSVTCYVKKRPDTDLGGADMELWDRVTKELARKYNFDLNIVEVDEMPDKPVVTFILCPVISRVASNAEHALKGVVSKKNMVLLLFHPVAPHISFSGNTKWVLVEPKHQALGDIVDVVMWSTGAGGSLYDSPQNSDAVSQICDFIAIQHHSSTAN